MEAKNDEAVAPRRRPRSTIVPGRRIPELALLAMHGIDDNSYRQLRTVESNRSVQDQNQTPSFRANLDLHGEFPDPDPDPTIVSGGGSPRNQSGRDLFGSPVRVEYEDEPVPFIQPVFKKEPETSIAKDRPKRNRIPVVRWWLGEKPIYNQNGTFIGVSEVFSPKSLEKTEKELNTLRSKRSRKSKKSGKSVAKKRMRKLK